MTDTPNDAPSGGAPQTPSQPVEQQKKVDTAQKTEKTEQNTGSSKGKPAKEEAKTPEAFGEKKLTGAELKAKAKAEKAARRAQKTVTKEVAKAEAAVSSSPQQLGPAASEVKGKQKGKDGAAAGPGGRPPLPKTVPSVIITEQKVQIPECFSHLSMAKRIPMTQADKDVHPAVLKLGQQMATFTIDESISRLKATLLAFKEVL